jgi:hypothetical protein
MKTCPVCQNQVEDNFTGSCSNLECGWEFELFGGELTQELQRQYEERLKKLRSIYNNRKSEDDKKKENKLLDEIERLKKENNNAKNIPKEQSNPEKSAKKIIEKSEPEGFVNKPRLIPPKRISEETQRRKRKRRNNMLLILIGAMLCFALIVILLYDNSNRVQFVKPPINAVEIAYKKAEMANSYESYGNFLLSYPQSSYSSLARLKMVEIAYKKVEKENTIDSYFKFQGLYPNSTYSKAIQLKINQLLAKKNTKSDNSIETGRIQPKYIPDGNGNGVRKLPNLPEDPIEMINILCDQNYTADIRNSLGEMVKQKAFANKEVVIVTYYDANMKTRTNAEKVDDYINRIKNWDDILQVVEIKSERNKNNQLTRLEVYEKVKK